MSTYLQIQLVNTKDVNYMLIDKMYMPLLLIFEDSSRPQPSPPASKQFKRYLRTSYCIAANN